jgi:hypothetical protein
MFADLHAESIIPASNRELTLWVLGLMLVATLIILVPQLLKAHLRKMEMQHQEHLKALEMGQPLPVTDDRSRVAGRMALLVPMVVMIAAGTVTCFLAIYNSDSIFPVSLAVWVVGGVVSLASITAGVALVSRLANLEEFAEEEKPDDEFTQSGYPR